MSNKKGQVAFIAFGKLALGIVLFFPFMSIYEEMSVHLLSTITNVFIRIIIYALPFLYWVAVIFLFMLTFRGQE